jgi:FHA domain
MSDWKTQLEPLDSSAVVRTMDESKLIRPMRRVAYPVITLVDDGKIDQGEVIRIRKEIFSFGRSEGDVTFPVESLLSARHCRFVLHRHEDHQYHWAIEDLDSRHGTYMRCAEIELSPGMEFLAGGTRFRLIGPKRLRLNMTGGNVSYYQATIDHSSKVEYLEICSYAINHIPQSIQLDRRQLDVGRLTNQALKVDPFLEPSHFSIEKSSEGKWKVIDNKSHNGIWVRIHTAFLASHSQLIIGEQRLVFQLPDIF